MADGLVFSGCDVLEGQEVFGYLAAFIVDFVNFCNVVVGCQFVIGLGVRELSKGFLVILFNWPNDYVSSFVRFHDVRSLLVLEIGEGVQDWFRCCFCISCDWGS